MAYQSVGGVYMPAPVSAIPSLTASTLTAGTHQFAWCGRVWNKDKASKDIRTVGFLPGTVTTGSSTLRLSLQDLDAANQARPDGGVDQNVTFADTAITSDTFYTSGNLSADRTVAFGEKLAVVLDYSSYGSGSIGVQNPALGALLGGTWSTLFTASWSIQTMIPSVVLGFSDGTFGSLGYPGRNWPMSALGTVAPGSGSTPDEYALRFTVPFACKVTGGWFTVSPGGAGRNFTISLYEGTSLLGSEAFDAEQVAAATNRCVEANFGAEITLTPSTVYYLAIKPSTASANTYHYFDVASANHLQAHAGGTEWYYADRVDSGAWSNITTTRRLYGGLIISALDDGVSTGGNFVIGG
jgi:hypothetical protein